jgi:HEPN domain-containing protein
MNTEIPKPVDLQFTDEELHKVLTEIDAELRAKNPQVSGRELRGWSAFCRRFNVSMAMHDPLAERIFNWFKQQYGDRLRVDWNFGNTAVEIRHDVYAVKLGFFFGTGIVYCDPKLSGIPSSTKASFNPRAAFRSNLFEKIDGLTPEFIKDLTSEECNRMLEAYARGFLSFSRMKDIQATPDRPGAPLSKEALDDLNQSATHLTASKPNYGFSRWSSLQAAEKTLKSYAVQNDGKLLKTHDLTKLEKEAVNVGLAALKPSLLQDIQCAPDVRYAADSVTKDEALRAHYAVMTLCSQMAPRLKPQSGWISDVKFGTCEIAGEKRPIKALMVMRGKPRRA